MPTAAERGQRRADVPAPLVVDASAVVTLLIDPGPAGDAVAARMRHATLLAPALMPFEVANLLRRRRDAGLLSGAEADLAHAELIDLPIDLWPWLAIAARAWELGANLSSYDAAYVALAEQTDAPLLTRDARLASAPGIRARVELV
ncbi:type II toxin-antitoxin system VapC family toxin [Agromyces sp. NPDC004153]